ncbi:MAG: flagellar biosynthetic protein FliO [Planctomycetota bacterium]
MSTNRKWLLLPPVVALLIVLGPLSMRPEPARAGTSPLAASSEPAPIAAPSAGRDAPPALPQAPDLWQVGSTLFGVLLLGGAGLMVLRRLRQGPKVTGTGAIQLRQSLRLSGKQVVHAVEFDGRVLLLGEGERGLQLLHAGAPATDLLDEPVAPTAAAADDDGAVPRDLVLPRPPARAASTAPAEVARAAATARQRRAAATAPAERPQSSGILGDFRALLAKAGR